MPCCAALRRWQAPASFPAPNFAKRLVITACGAYGAGAMPALSLRTLNPGAKEWTCVNVA